VPAYPLLAFCYWDLGSLNGTLEPFGVRLELDKGLYSKAAGFLRIATVMDFIVARLYLVLEAFVGLRA